MNTTEKLSELNTKALEIAEKYPNDYHNRKDYREIIDQKSSILRGKNKYFTNNSYLKS